MLNIVRVEHPSEEGELVYFNSFNHSSVALWFSMVFRQNNVWILKEIYTKKLRADWSWGMLVIIRWGIFCLPVCYPKI